MRALQILGYVIWLAWQVLVAATEVVVDNLRPRQRAHPILVELPLRVDRDGEIVCFAASITMTPATLVCGVRDRGDHRSFIVHCIFGRDPEALVASFRDMEERLAPRVRGMGARPARLIDEYSAGGAPDPGAGVGTQNEEPGTAPGREVGQ